MRFECSSMPSKAQLSTLQLPTVAGRAHLGVRRSCGAFQHLYCQLEAEEQLVRLEQAGAHVGVHVAGQLVGQGAQARLQGWLLLAGPQGLGMESSEMEGGVQPCKVLL